VLAAFVDGPRAHGYIDGKNLKRETDTRTGATSAGPDWYVSWFRLNVQVIAPSDVWRRVSRVQVATSPG
jgi:hypothetical protein